MRPIMKYAGLGLLAGLLLTTSAQAIQMDLKQSLQKLSSNQTIDLQQIAEKKSHSVEVEAFLYELSIGIANIELNEASQLTLDWLKNYQPRYIQPNKHSPLEQQMVPLYDIPSMALRTENKLNFAAAQKQLVQMLMEQDYAKLLDVFSAASTAYKNGIIYALKQSDMNLESLADYLLSYSEETLINAAVANKSGRVDLAEKVLKQNQSYASSLVLRALPKHYEQNERLALLKRASQFPENDALLAWSAMHSLKDPLVKQAFLDQLKSRSRTQSAVKLLAEVEVAK
ncbi:MAG: hypothetical protein ACWA5R_01330 [bacterium]